MSDSPEGSENQTPPLKEWDRVRVRESYLRLWPRKDFDKLRGRCGTIVRIDGPHVDVMMDKTHPKATPYIYPFAAHALELAPDCHIDKPLNRAKTAERDAENFE